MIENKLEAPYRRGELLSERRKITREWANDVGKQQAEVISTHQPT